MSITFLSKDTDLRFPHFIVLKASAGSGKTYALSRRFVQFLLSDSITKNKLRNILAITFSNNAAKEMRERILDCLKELYFEDKSAIQDFLNLISMDTHQIPAKAGSLIDEIIGNYSDFQVKTIDSFTTSVFKASAIDFGYNPEFEIMLSSDPLLEYSFNLFLRNVKDGSDESKILDSVIKIIAQQKDSDSAFLWDPASRLLEEQKKIYTKLASTGESPAITDYSALIKDSCKQIKKKLEAIDQEIQKSGLSKNTNSSFWRILEATQEGRFTELIGAGLKTLPVKKLDKKSNQQAAYDEIINMWAEATSLISEYINLYSRSYFMPYLEVYNALHEIIESTKKNQGRIFIGDINFYLATYLNKQIVPDIYFRIGEKIYHYLIDEFQDTSPIQWNNLSPLIENSLSQDGSLFVVGDTKQAIYGFRNADYKIMKKSEETNIFPSASHQVAELDTNFRSLAKILEFSEKVFKQNAVSNPEYSVAASKSGLNNYCQKPKKGAEDGYVELTILERNDDDPPERQKIFEIISDLLKRGYICHDIAILTPRNEHVVTVSRWLNEKNISFISMSSLDVRRRKITGEIISLIKFLNSPIDDLSFVTFITGDIFTENLALSGIKDALSAIHEFLFEKRGVSPLYKEFKDKFGNIWERFFDKLLKRAGYLPLYEIVVEIIKTFKIFEIKSDEEAALSKILEIVKNFESSGYNSLGDFLEFAESDSSSSEWDIALPSNTNAVKVMTIHKAKGLGFPVVITLLYGEKGKRFDYIIEKDNGEISLLKINSKIANGNQNLQRLYSEEQINEMANKLNSLYVGFTRAKRELYVIGIKRKSDSYPFDLLPINDYPPSDNKTSQTTLSGGDSQNELLAYYYMDEIVSYEADKPLNLEERRWGEFIHRVLSFVEYADKDLDYNLSEIIQRVKKEMRLEYSENQIRDLVSKVINDESLSEFFKFRLGRQIKNEFEIVSSYGGLFRLDRLVCDIDSATVIDYKTGIDEDSHAEHVQQIRNYINILRDIYPDKKLKGIIVYIGREDIKIMSEAL
jgi:ATP-dependent exoDNAse (exonuclease V) beta subunit